MYRKLIPLLLCLSTVLSAPQQNSNITYVKRQVEVEYSKPELKPSERESRIEKVPLTIPGNVSKDDTAPKSEDKDFSSNTNKDSEKIQTAQANKDQSTYNYSDRIYSIKTKPKMNSNNTTRSIPTDETDTRTEIENSEILLRETKDFDIVPAESIFSDRVATKEDTVNDETETTESDDTITEKYEEDPTTNMEPDEVTTKVPSPRFLPKLSYFEKSTYGSFSQNLIANPGKRRFRSRCRCEKIWNCAKLQISVPRCPEEYFMCCL